MPNSTIANIPENPPESEQVCTTCGFSKPLSLFRTTKVRGRIYRRGMCSDCKRAYDRPFQKRWRELHPEEQREYERQRPPRHNGAALTDFAKRNPEAATVIRQAVKAVQRAVRDGVLVRPSECEACGVSGVRIEAAHFDYNELLRVRWLCHSCHIKWDRAEPKTRRYRSETPVASRVTGGS